MTDNVCPLCQAGNERIVWRDDLLRVIQVEDAAYPGFCRVILNRHVKEMTDLSQAERARLMHAVFCVESVLRELLQPDKINLATLGNQVPHLHWHVIPRFADDAHFPDPVWGSARRTGTAHPVDRGRLAERVRQAMSTAPRPD